MGSLLPKLGQLLMDEYNLHKRVKKDVRFLSRELESMHAALVKVGDVPRDQLDTQVKLWADEVRELSYDMEDVVDKFLVRVDGIHPHDDANRFKGLMKRMVGVFKKGKNHHRIADAIKDIKEQLQEVAARRDRNKVDGSAPNPIKAIPIDPRLRALYNRQVKLWADEVRELSYNMEDVVDKFLVRVEGIQQPHDHTGRFKELKNKMVGLFKKGKNHHRIADAIKEIKEQLEEVAARRDRNNVDGITPNPIKAIPIDPRLRALYIEATELVGIYGQRDQDLLRQLINKLHEFLENKRYLIIIDDIWDQNLWKDINIAFSIMNNLGSRLITTTRILNVSESCCSSSNDSIYQMEPLSTDDSRRLFCKRIFPSDTGCPNEFEQVSRDILKKCGGVPLAIITIASALAGGEKVKPKHEWDILLQSLGSGLTEENSLDEMRRILSFSYYDLPFHLRTCLLYLSIYPEDREIDRDSLIWKWVAEGFVHHGNQGTSLFLLGLDYFNQLINRSMIQPIYSISGNVYACRIHDMVLDLICNLSNEAKFVNLLDGTGNSMSSQSNCRRLSLQKRNEDHQAKPLTDIKSMSRMRSITIFPPAIKLMPSLSRFEVLRVLDLSGCNLGGNSNLQLNLKDVGHLIHLRYLGLAGTQISKLPAEIGKLQFLEVLDLGNNHNLKELPSTVCNFRRLIYLNLVFCHVVPPVGVLQNLTSIEVLTGILFSLNIIAQELGNLKRLRVLEICFKDGNLDLYEGFVKSLCNLHHIESLIIDCKSIETSSFELMDLLGERWIPPVHLREFKSFMPSQLSALRGWIQRDPSHLSNLSELILTSVKDVQQDDVEIIGGLLSLRSLLIKSTYQTQRLLVIPADGFRCIVDFHLDCGSATQILFEPGALPRAEAVLFSLGVRVAKEDGNSDFDLGLQGSFENLCRFVSVYIYCGGARVREAKEAEAAVRRALEAHPSHPRIYIDMSPRIAKGAHDVDLCEVEN
ncbi:hypothetical protein ZWY2020_054526 [Hordeum vulgare]|nr:hypothetical protein ZWY2020_054526 [Hordeum vulgare]